MLLCQIWSFGQQEFIQGRLLDENSDEPIVFATIRIKGKAIGVISNQDGGFKIPMNFKIQGTFLEISCLGYETKSVSLSLLKENIVNNIFMSPALMKLDETIVTAKRKKVAVKKIIATALKRIPENYPMNPFSLIGYYRDYQLQENEYVNLNEAFIQIFDSGFMVDDYKKTQYGLFTYSRNRDFKIDSLAAKPYDYKNKAKIIPNVELISEYGGNELILLHLHDAIRNHNITTYSYVDKMVDDFIRQHRFSMVGSMFYDDEAVYEIDIRKNIHPFHVRGTIYIDENDFAIRKLRYAVYKQRMNYQSNSTALQYSSRIEELIYDIIVEYTEVNEKMYLNYISFHNKFTVLRPALFRIQKMYLDKDKNYLVVELNRPAVNLEKLQLSDFDLRYRENRIRFKKLIKRTEKIIVLQLSSNKNQMEILNELFEHTTEFDKKRLFLRIRNLIDEDGNHLNKQSSEHLDQFREFFTQKVIGEGNDSLSIDKANFILKTKALHNPKQPLMFSKHGQDYWMNTPLKRIEN